MSVLHLKSALSPEQRVQKRQLIVRDSLALLTLLAITCALFFATWLLFRSFSDHRAELAQRWRIRGENALHQGRPGPAIDALRSALQYSPDEREIEIELAQALAAAGRLQEASAYFNTLWEAEPGNGHINLALARLAAQQNNQPGALRYYQAAIDGTWEGDGSVRRREVRLEMVQYLLAHQQYEQARSELLIAEGNAPDDPAVRTQIAQQLETAHDPANALEIYQSILRRKPPRLDALEGAARSTYALGHYLQAKQYLERATSHPDFNKEPNDRRQKIHDMLNDATHLLLLYPSSQLAPRGRAERILHDRALARERFQACSQSQAGTSGHGDVLAMQSLNQRWQQETKPPTRMDLEKNPDLQQAEIQLIYDTEKLTASQCGPPTGDDALLLKIAQAPENVEAQ